MAVAVRADFLSMSIRKGPQVLLRSGYVYQLVVKESQVAPDKITNRIRVVGVVIDDLDPVALVRAVVKGVYLREVGSELEFNVARIAT